MLQIELQAFRVASTFFRVANEKLLVAGLFWQNLVKIWQIINADAS